MLTSGRSDRVEVIFDESGEGILERDEQWDLAVIVSVLHHIPDYLRFCDRLSGLIAPGGGIFTVQDPLYYPRMSKVAHRADRAAYLTWRLFQGDYARGINTRLRRLRGVYDDTQPSDLVEYHVVRDGVDERGDRGPAAAAVQGRGDLPLLVEPGSAVAAGGRPDPAEDDVRRGSDAPSRVAVSNNGRLGPLCETSVVLCRIPRSSLAACSRPC